MAEVDLKQKFPNMTPIKSAPSLSTINGCGFRLYGSRDADAYTGTHVATWCLTILYLPVLMLRAYRVAQGANGKWYFIGREPLSGRARNWNKLLLTAVLATTAGVSYYAYTSTPAYQAKRQMASAAKHASAGELGEAARIYQKLAVAGAEQSGEATTALAAMVDGPCAQAPLREAAGTYEAAALVARRRGTPSPNELATKGLALVAARGEGDPAPALSILAAVRPLVLDTRNLDTHRLKLLRLLATKEPGNLEVVVPLASLLAEQDQVAEAKKLLLPLRDKLGDGEGARVLGTVLGREGDYDGAYALLWPYVKPRLDRLHDAERGFEAALKQLEEREIELLRQNKGPSDFYTRYDQASEDAKHAMVSEYVDGRIRNEPQYTQAQDALQHAAEVVPVAMDLGIVSLQRAHAAPDAAARKAQLEAAENVFLAVRGVAGESDEYRLSLGEVYYWLGKQAEGHKLFDEFLAAKQRSFAATLQIARRLRMLGMDAETRTLAEEAYAKGAKPEERYAAASLRSAAFKDNDDKIDWLSKAGTADPEIKATLERARGDRALESGQDAAAVGFYRSALDAYARMPRNSGTLNETALASYAMFRASGDDKALERCYDAFQQAADLDPSNSILLHNAGSTLLDAALADIVGKDADLRMLRETGRLGMLSYLYNDQPSRDAVVQRVKAHPGVARAVSFLEKVTVIAPKGADTFAELAALHEFTRDEAALRKIEQRLRTADVDTSDGLEAAKNFVSKAKDAQHVPKLAASLKRRAERLPALRAKGGITAAIAVDEMAEAILNVHAYTGKGDLAEVVKLAEEAHRLAPSASTSGTLFSALVARAADELGRGDAGFKAFWETNNRSAGAAVLLAAVAMQPGPTRDAILKHPDVRRALDIVRGWSRQFPSGGSPLEWALLKSAEAAEADVLAQRFRQNQCERLEHTINAMLAPASVESAIQRHWFHEAVGEADQAREALTKVAAFGLPMPLKP
jgi:hypothetical protein